MFRLLFLRTFNIWFNTFNFVFDSSISNVFVFCIHRQKAHIYFFQLQIELLFIHILILSYYFWRVLLLSLSHLYLNKKSIQSQFKVLISYVKKGSHLYMHCHPWLAWQGVWKGTGGTHTKMLLLTIDLFIPFIFFFLFFVTFNNLKNRVFILFFIFHKKLWELRSTLVLENPLTYM